MGTWWDQLVEWALTAIDFVRDVASLGEWSRVRGDVTPNIKIRRMR